MPKHTPQKLIKEKTCWLFLTCSTEKRHVEDMVLGIDCLRSIGIADKDIYLFSDQPEKHVLLSLYSFTKNIFELSDFRQITPAISGYDHVILVIGGHGSQEGLDGANFKMAPQELIETLRQIKGISAGIVVAGQCYAGLFNYLSVGDTEPQFVVLGATNLNPSLSDTAELAPAISSVGGKNDLKSWSANIFLLNFFLWMKSPVDVDGDNKTSLLDAYKYAGVKANERLRSSKAELHYGVEVLKSQQMERLIHGPKLTQGTASAEDSLRYIKHMMDVNAAQLQISEQLDMLYLSQEPWILHSQFARDFVVGW